MDQKHDEKLEELRGYVRSIEYMKYTLNSLAYWDKITVMPAKGIHYRSEVMAYLGSELYRMFSSQELHRLVDYFEAAETGDQLVDSMVRRIKRNYIYVNKVPQEEYGRYISLIATAETIWEEAKEKNDFSIFAPCLSEIVETFKSFAGYWGYEEDPYDALMGYYEEGVTVKVMDQVAEELKEFIATLLKKISGSPVEPSEKHFFGSFPKEQQRQLSEFLLKTIGFDFSAGRLDESTHPTTLANSPDDVRIVTSYNERDIRTGLFNALHEGGKGLYEQDIDKELLGTLLAEVASFGVEEAEARFYENIVGRSRGFWDCYYTELMNRFPGLGELSAEEFYRSINIVKPSLIRMDADELTYVLHIIIRYEIEKDLINGRISVEKLPEIWNEKYRQYLGIEPDCDRDGVLQDIHWAGGYFGFFPSYLLANLYAAQFMHAMEKETGDMNQLLREGRISQIHQWLAENVHRFGAVYTPEELVKKVSGESLTSRYYIDYLRRKYDEVYQLAE